MRDLDDLVAELKQKRDELRVKMHLGSRELRDEWKEWERKMESFVAKARLEESGEGISQALGQLGSELKTGYKRIVDAVKND